ncbi:MAG: hypothetical protein IPK60_13675 [Sandaracinaceae bacterium]|nr:hypothetical protein [Sandaracinaceae bacterium]
MTLLPARFSLCFLALLTAVSGCTAGVGAGSDTEEVVTADGDDGKADGAIELRVRASDTTLWVDKLLTRVGDSLVLSGRTSRNLTSGSPFIFDDVYGQWSQPSTRTFEVRWEAGEARGLLSGVDLFFGLGFSPSSSRPDALTSHTRVQPRLVAFEGRGMSLSADVHPVVSGGRTVFRIRGTTREKIFGLHAQAGDVALSDVAVLDDTHFQIDLLDDHVLALFGSESRLSVTVDLRNGPQTKSASVALRVATLGLTARDAYEVWPVITCDQDVLACLDGLPDGTTDLGPCGDARPVLACRAQAGVTMDDTRLAAAIATIGARLDAIGLAADASGLVGRDREAAFTEGAYATVEESLTDLAGRWYADVAALEAAQNTAIETALDRVYARPLDLVEAHTPVAGDLNATRAVFADAILAHLASLNLSNTEYGRSLESVVHENRAGHVAAIRFMRDEASPEIIGENTYYIAQWLGAHVEAIINPASGAVTSILFEID